MDKNFGTEGVYVLNQQRTQIVCIEQTIILNKHRKSGPLERRGEKIAFKQLIIKKKSQ